NAKVCSPQLSATSESTAVVHHHQSVPPPSVPSRHDRWAQSTACWPPPSPTHSAPGERRPMGTEPRMRTEPTLRAVRSTGRLCEKSLFPKCGLIKSTACRVRMLQKQSFHTVSAFVRLWVGARCLVPPVSPCPSTGSPHPPR